MPENRWTVLLYLCGDTPELAPHIHEDAAEALKAKLADNLSVAMFVDRHSSIEAGGAVRYLLRPNQPPPPPERLGPVDSGSTATLRDFLLWGIRELPADHYALVIGGTGMFDPNSVIGHPENNWTEVFAICDDDSAHTAMEIADLRDVIESVLEESRVDRFRIVAFDMCRMQFLEVAYEFETVAEIVVAPQTEVPPAGWDYEKLLNAWGAAIQPPSDQAEPPFEAIAAEVAKAIVREASEAYVRGGGAEVMISALDVTRLTDLTRDFDALTLAYLGALGDFIAWEARNAVMKSTLGDSNAYDLRQLLTRIKEELGTRVGQQIHIWLGWVLTRADAARRDDYAAALERACVRLRASASAGARTAGADAAPLIDKLTQELREVRKRSKERTKTKLDEVHLSSGRIDGCRDVWELCFRDSSLLPPRLREEYAALRQERERAEYLAKLASRTLRHFGDDNGQVGLILERTPPRPDGQALCGVALYRPQQLDRLIDSNYLKLEFSRKVHWAALLGATNLIAHDHRALWRVVSSMLGSADPRGRDDLIERLVGQTSVGLSYRGQFRSLTPSPLVTLSLEPLPNGQTWDETAMSDRYRLRLESIRRDATLKENVTRVNPSTIECALSALEDLLKDGWVDSEALDQIESFGRTLGEDIIQDLDGSLSAELASSDRDVHLQLQIPPRLMKYPWELMHDGHAWLSERYALGRQVFMEQSAVRWSATRRTGGVRVLIIGDPILQGVKQLRQLPGARDEADQVAALFERLQEQVGVALEFDRRRDARIHQVFTRDECRRLLRSGAYDIIHFAGHALFDRDEPLRSGWVLSDGALWAQEIRNTLARSAPPWLVYANACEAAMDEPSPRAKYQGDVHGLASAFINKGVGAYIAPLWPIDDGMAMKLAADFYTLMALDRMTVGEALCHAKRRAKAAVLGNGDARDALITVPANMGLSWASLVLYGDPTQTLVHQMAARNDNRLAVAVPSRPPDHARSLRPRRSALHGEAPLQAAPSTLVDTVGGPGMRAVGRLRGPSDLQDGEQELLIIERGGVRYWATSLDGEPVSIQNWTAVPEGSPVSREATEGMPRVAAFAESKLKRDRGFSDYVKVVARWATGRLDHGLIAEVVRQYDQDIVPSEGLLLHDPETHKLRPYSRSDEQLTGPNPQATGCLLLIHGTFSRSRSPVEKLGEGFFEWAHRNYRQVLALDHWTLSKSPLENAQMLCRLLPSWIATGRSLDIVTHSRGGLVARALVQLLAKEDQDAGRIAAAVDRVIFVGTPNFGTSLADPKNWARAADLLINLVHVDAFGLYGKLSGFLARLAVARLGEDLLERIPGLQAQNPAARHPKDVLVRLRNAKKPEHVRFSAVSSNYEPRRDEAHLKFIAKLAGDAAADQFFQGFNDLVVNSRNVWLDASMSPAPEFVERKDVLVITPADSGFDAGNGPFANLYGVHHTNLFETEQTRQFLVDRLRRMPSA